MYVYNMLVMNTVMAVETIVEFESEKDEFCLLSWVQSWLMYVDIAWILRVSGPLLRGSFTGCQ